MKKLFNSVACALALFISGSVSAAQTDTKVTSQTATFSSGFTGDLEKIVAAHRGDMGIYCHHLGTSETISINADEPFPTASTIKVAVMCTAFDLLANGTGPYKTYYDTRPYDASTSTGGSGFIRNYQDGTKLELKELIHLMITVSDNIGTNMLVEWIGIDKVNNWLADHGFQQTRMFSTIGSAIVADPEGRKEWGLGRTTPAEMGRLMEMIATGKAGTTSTTDEMLRILSHQYFDGCIAGGIPPMTYIGSKSGALNRQRADNAIIASPGGTYILSVYTNNNKSTAWDSTNEGEIAIRKVSHLTWKHFNPESTWEPAPGSDKF